MWCRLIGNFLQRQPTAGAALPSALTKHSRIEFMLDFISTSKNSVKTWLADLFPRVAISGNGVALLAAQITDLENRCEGIHRRIDRRCAKENASETFAMRVLPRRINKKAKYGANDYAKQSTLSCAK